MVIFTPLCQKRPTRTAVQHGPGKPHLDAQSLGVSASTSTTGCGSDPVLGVGGAGKRGQGRARPRKREKQALLQLCASSASLCASSAHSGALQVQLPGGQDGDIPRVTPARDVPRGTCGVVTSPAWREGAKGGPLTPHPLWGPPNPYRTSDQSTFLRLPVACRIMFGLDQEEDKPYFSKI